MGAINVGEVYYFLRKTHSERIAESWRDLQATVPATIEVPTANEIWDAALLKARYPIRMQPRSPPRWGTSTGILW
jgi:hypothetical protein